MKDLWPDSRALLDAGRDGEEPGAHDYERNRRALAQKLGASVVLASVGMVSTTGAAAASGAAGTGALTSVVLSFVLGGAVGGAAAMSTTWMHENASRSAPAVVSTMPAPPANGKASDRANAEIHAPAPERPAFPADDSATSSHEGRVDVLPKSPQMNVVEGTPTAAREAPSHGGLAEAPSTAEGPAPSNVGEELGLLRAAQERLHTGAPAAALALLDEHARRFPRGALVEERRASRILALCQLGEVAAGRAEADQFILQLPMSPFVERIRRACTR
jgi:hypothetical protein